MDIFYRHPAFASCRPYDRASVSRQSYTTLAPFFVILFISSTACFLLAVFFIVCRIVDMYQSSNAHLSLSEGAAVFVLFFHSLYASSAFPLTGTR